MTMRPGFGARHPEFGSLLAELTPAASTETIWGSLRLRVSAYLSDRRVPDELVSSVRCIVECDGRLVVTESPDDVNVWPGGRRETGETMRQTALREVHEETGFRVEADSLRLLGFLHFEHLAPVPLDYRYPHPDFVHLILNGRAPDRAVEDWKDVDGYVLRSWLEPVADVENLPLDPVALPFIDALPRSTGHHGV